MSRAPDRQAHRGGVHVHDLQVRVEIDDSHVHEIGEVLAILRLVGKVALESGVVGTELLDAVDRVALGPTPDSDRILRRVASARRCAASATTNPIASAIAMTGQGSTGRASHTSPIGLRRQARRSTEGCRRRSSVSSARHGRVSRSHSVAG